MLKAYRLSGLVLLCSCLQRIVTTGKLMCGCSQQSAFKSCKWMSGMHPATILSWTKVLLSMHLSPVSLTIAGVFG